MRAYIFGYFCITMFNSEASCPGGLKIEQEPLEGPKQTKLHIDANAMRVRAREKRY